MNEHDDLLKRLGQLPVHAERNDRARDAARAAFVRSFERTSAIERLFLASARASVPIVLASVVGVYLFWAFAAAIAMVR